MVSGFRQIMSPSFTHAITADSTAIAVICKIAAQTGLVTRYDSKLPISQLACRSLFSYWPLVIAAAWCKMEYQPHNNDQYARYTAPRDVRLTFHIQRSLAAELLSARRFVTLPLVNLFQ